MQRPTKYIIAKILTVVSSNSLSLGKDKKLKADG
jgi:hypothetical protein